MVVGRLLSALWGNGHWSGCPVAVIGRCVRSLHKAASDKLIVIAPVWGKKESGAEFLNFKYAAEMRILREFPVSLALFYTPIF